jgi:hypothetical protein
MFEDKSVSRVQVSREMQDWWNTQIIRAGEEGASGGEEGTAQGESSNDKDDHESEVKKDREKDGEQWGGTMPGPGGT